MKNLYLAILILFLSLPSFSQIQINGIVKDEKGEPVFAANVFLKSLPQKGTTTNFDGEFTLDISTRNDTLVVSFIGYKTKEIPLMEIETGNK